MSKCSRSEMNDYADCSGDVFLRTSHSGLTQSWMCRGHAAELDESLAAIGQRYPEIYHPEDCLCPGCIGDAP